MTNLSVIENKISFIRQQIEILDLFKKFTLGEIEKDLFIKGALERYLFLTVQATIDLAESLVSLKGFRKPSTMSDTFYILNANKIIDSDFADTLIKMVGFRNIITHAYRQIDYKVLFDVLHNKTSDVVRFLKIIEELYF